jgi:hypothetical protein
MTKGQFDTSEINVTYLLGAGASAKALPTVKATGTTESVSHGLRSFGDLIRADLTIDSKHQPFLQEVVQDLYWLADGSDKFGTPDTFAKYLYLKDRDSVRRLKRALTFYFTHEQYIKSKFDERALIFLTSVMQLGEVFPTNIRILNWNYDSQIQTAAEIFRNEKFFKTMGASTHKPPLINYFPVLGWNMNQNRNDIQMVHLNGIAGYYFDTTQNLILSHGLNEKPKNMDELLTRLSYQSDRRHDLLTFAWEIDTEASHYLSKRLDYAKQMIAGTDILVVIGYSFPFFNRQVDSVIFETLKASNRFKKVFFQDPFKSGDFLKNQFSLSDEIDVRHIDSKDNYYIPTEL